MSTTRSLNVNSFCATSKDLSSGNSFKLSRASFMMRKSLKNLKSPGKHLSMNSLKEPYFRFISTRKSSTTPRPSNTSGQFLTFIKASPSSKAWNTPNLNSFKYSKAGAPSSILTTSTLLPSSGVIKTAKNKILSSTLSISTLIIWISPSFNKSTDILKWAQVSTTIKLMYVMKSLSSLHLITPKNSWNKKCTIKLLKFSHLSKPCLKSRPSATLLSQKLSSSLFSENTQIKSPSMPVVKPLSISLNTSQLMTRESNKSLRQILLRQNTSTRVSKDK